MAAAGRPGPRGSAVPQMDSVAPEANEYGLQVRPMGLKVHYTFDKDNQVNCLARWPHVLQIQTIPLDEKNSIGVVDLRTCLMAVANCSPEIVSQQDNDYTVYAFDYSEPDTPLVGQGMLSWGLDPNGDPQSQQLVTGRVAKNLLAIFGNGIRETLEVKLKLNAVPKVHRAEGSSFNMDCQNMRPAPTPIDTTNAEWNSFVQSNPSLGRSVSVNAVPSPALGPVTFDHFTPENRFPDIRSDCMPQQLSRPPSIAPAPSQVPHTEPGSSQPAVETVSTRPSRPSRPSSRASRKAPTGRPRGRPRKKPVETGNTSAAEEATDADEGPHRKRAKVTKVDYSNVAPFASAPDSLRVAASTSGSLRNLRPIAAAGSAPPAAHLQDIPRNPTPVPQGPMLQKQQQQQRKRPSTMAPRRGSLAELENAASYPSSFNQRHLQMGMAQDARSPTESIVQSPDQGFTPESAADLGSSPPVPRVGAYIQSSPMPSSPILPTMPMGPVDSGFMSGDIDDLFDEEELTQELPRRESQTDCLPRLAATKPTTQPPPALKGRTSQPQSFDFQEVNPGPPELLPVTSIFNPAGRAKSLNRGMAPTKPAVSRTLKRSNTASCPPPSELEPIPQEQHTSQDAPQAAQVSPEVLDNSPAFQAADGAKQPDVTSAKAEEGDARDARGQASQTPSNDTRSNESTPMAPPKEQPSIMTMPPVATLEPTPPGPAPKERQSLPPRPPSRPASRGVTVPPSVPASDPAPETMTLTLPQVSHSEAPAPATDAVPDASDPPKFNKNQVKKQSIKERLESAIQKGEMPPFCNNCGAIETPTWRKIWTQEHQGVPGSYQYSDKPGCVTTVDILERNAEGQPTMYRLVKKNLGATDYRGDWNELLLCNPCGIWLAKFKCHRPPDRWDKDAARLNQPRRKRESKAGSSRAKKPRTKSDGQLNPTSEAYFATDPIGPGDHRQASPSSQQGGGGTDGQSTRQNSAVAEAGDGNRTQPSQPTTTKMPSLLGSPNQKGPGSTHSRGSGTADSPIAVEDDLGTTRRLLFPSPRKDGVPKVLGELAVNVVQTGPNLLESKPAATSKGEEKRHLTRPATPPLPAGDDLDHQLFGTPPPRPSTPPPKAANGPFKTPTRPTPSHRPITRSISRSIRSAKSIPKSPSQAILLLQRTPSRTPRSTGPNALTLSSGKRRNLHARFAIDDDGRAHAHFDSPFTATLNQLLSEANGFTAGSPSHGLVDLDLSSLPNLDTEDVQQLANSGALDFGNFLNTDMPMPSSPPLLRSGHVMNFGEILGELGNSEL